MKEVRKFHFVTKKFKDWKIKLFFKNCKRVNFLKTSVNAHTCWLPPGFNRHFLCVHGDKIYLIKKYVCIPLLFIIFWGGNQNEKKHTNRKRTNKFRSIKGGE